MQFQDSPRAVWALTFDANSRLLCGCQDLAVSVDHTNYVLLPFDDAVTHLYLGAKSKVSLSWQGEEYSIRLADMGPTQSMSLLPEVIKEMQC